MSNSQDRGTAALAIDGFIGILLWMLCITSAVAAETKPTWQQQWEQIVQGAKKEGQVTVLRP
jgi:hypothetical protein